MNFDRENRDEEKCQKVVYYLSTTIQLLFIYLYLSKLSIKTKLGEIATHRDFVGISGN